MDPTIFLTSNTSRIIKKDNGKINYKFDDVNFEDVKKTELQYPSIDVVKIYIPLSLGLSTFTDYSAVIWSNIDAVHNYTKRKYRLEKTYTKSVLNSATTNLERDETDSCSAVLLSHTTGGASEYIRYRVPNAQCYGINSVGTDLLWKLDTEVKLDPNDETDETTSFLIKQFPLGMDILLDCSLCTYTNSIKRAVYTLSSSGCYILRTSELDPQSVYICTLFFEEVSLFRPMSSICILPDFGIEDGEATCVYIICKNKRKLHGTELGELSKTLNDLNLQLPQSFNEWWNEIIKSINDMDNVISTAKFDKYKPFILWNIPDNKI
jgi:hypothetical protein